MTRDIARSTSLVALLLAWATAAQAQLEGLDEGQVVRNAQMVK